jgi:hypothetical protein
LRILSSAVLKVLVVSLALVAVITLLPTSSTASTTSKVIYGYVWDSAGNPLVGADVTLNMKRPDTSIRTTLTDETLSGGQYLVTFNPGEWEIGDTVEIISNYMGNMESNETESPLTNDTPQYLNVSYEFEIPEFGSATGLLITGGLLGVVAVVALVYFKKR